MYSHEVRCETSDTGAGRRSGPVSDSAGRLRRANSLGRMMVGHTVRTTTTRATAPLRSADANVRKRDEAILSLADDLVRVLGPMKGAALKIGQIIALFDFGLSNRATRDEFAARLAPLFDGVVPMEWSAIEKVLARELGRSLRRLDIDPEPLAAASLGQVHFAMLDGTMPVVVKVQYPGIDSAVRADLKNLKLFAKVGGPVMPGLNLDAIIDEIAAEVARECDYIAEAGNQARAWSLCVDHPCWKVPRVFPEMSTARVMVSEFFDGVQFADIVAGDRDRAEYAAEAIYRFYGGGVYEAGEFCADPHPGNVLGLPDGRLGFIDFGLYVRMSAESLADQTRVLRALIEGRYHDAYRDCRDLGMATAGSVGEADIVSMMSDIGFWFLTEDQVTITKDVARRAVTSLFVPGAAHLSTTRHTALPTDHIFSRRTDLAVCGLLGQLDATNRWGAIIREWIDGRPPATEMGAEIQRWRQGR